MSRKPFLTYKERIALDFLRVHGSVFVPMAGDKYCKFGRFGQGTETGTSPIEAETSDSLLDKGLCTTYVMSDERRLIVLTEDGKEAELALYRGGFKGRVPNTT